MTIYADDDDMIGATEAGRILGVSGGAIRAWARAGRLPGVRVGCVYRFRRGDVLDFARPAAEPRLEVQKGRNVGHERAMARLRADGLVD